MRRFVDQLSEPTTLAFTLVGVLTALTRYWL